MFFTRAILVSTLLATLLIGCNKVDTPPTPTLGGATGSVAAPASTLPPSDAKLPAAQAGTTPDSGNASGPSQATSRQLSNEQESTAMPLPGQANNHSTANPTGDKK